MSSGAPNEANRRLNPNNIFDPFLVGPSADSITSSQPLWNPLPARRNPQGFSIPYRLREGRVTGNPPSPDEKAKRRNARVVTRNNTTRIYWGNDNGDDDSGTSRPSRPPPARNAPSTRDLRATARSRRAEGPTNTVPQAPNRVARSNTRNTTKQPAKITRKRRAPKSKEEDEDDEDEDDEEDIYQSVSRAKRRRVAFISDDEEVTSAPQRPPPRARPQRKAPVPPPADDSSSGVGGGTGETTEADSNLDSSNDDDSSDEDEDEDENIGGDDGDDGDQNMVDVNARPYHRSHGLKQPRAIHQVTITANKGAEDASDEDMMNVNSRPYHRSRGLKQPRAIHQVAIVAVAAANERAEDGSDEDMVDADAQSAHRSHGLKQPRATHQVTATAIIANRKVEGENDNDQDMMDVDAQPSPLPLLPPPARRRQGIKQSRASIPTAATAIAREENAMDQGDDGIDLYGATPPPGNQDDLDETDQLPAPRPKRRDNIPKTCCRFCAIRPNITSTNPCDVQRLGTGGFLECTNCANNRSRFDATHRCRVDRMKRILRKYGSHDPPFYAIPACDKCILNGTPNTCDVDCTLGYACTNCGLDRCLANGTVMNGRPPIFPELPRWIRRECDNCATRPRDSLDGCSWLSNRTIWNAPCTHCRVDNVTCFDGGNVVAIHPPAPTLPMTWEVDLEPLFSGYVDLKNTTGWRQPCRRCKEDGRVCRVDAVAAAYACERCTQLGIDCIEENGRRRPIFNLARVGLGKSQPFQSCARCIEMGRNCDHQRPCDSCCNNRERRRCDPFSKQAVKSTNCIKGRLQNTSPLYYLAMGYGANGVNDVKDGTKLEHWIGPAIPIYSMRPEQHNFDFIASLGIELRRNLLAFGAPPSGGDQSNIRGLMPHDITVEQLVSTIMRHWAFPTTLHRHPNYANSVRSIRERARQANENVVEIAPPSGQARAVRAPSSNIAFDPRRSLAYHNAASSTQAGQAGQASMPLFPGFSEDMYTPTGGWAPNAYEQPDSTVGLFEASNPFSFDNDAPTWVDQNMIDASEAAEMMDILNLNADANQAAIDPALDLAFDPAFNLNFDPAADINFDQAFDLDFDQAFHLNFDPAND